MSYEVEAFNAARRRIIDNGDYRSQNSADKARKYIDALNTLIPLLPMRQQLGGNTGESIQWSISDLIKQRDSAEKWLTARQSTRRISYANPCGFRD